jgi:hypothetical protein
MAYNGEAISSVQGRAQGPNVDLVLVGGTYPGSGEETAHSLRGDMQRTTIPSHCKLCSDELKLNPVAPTDI